MDEQQQIARAIFEDAATTSSAVNFSGFRSFALEVPSGDHGTAVIVQMLSGDGSTWIDVLAITDTTNRVKGLTVLEQLAFEPLRQIRLKVGSGVSGQKIYYLHMIS